MGQGSEVEQNEQKSFNKKFPTISSFISSGEQLGLSAANQKTEKVEGRVTAGVTPPPKGF